jgi:hypothetical protein
MRDTRPWLHVSRSAVVCESGVDVHPVAARFERDRVVLLQDFVDGELLASVRQLIGRTAFLDHSHGRFGLELCLPDNAPASALLHLVLNDPELFRTAKAISGCPPIGCFTGRIYRMVPGAGHYDDWHTDALDSRLVGLSVNLSEDAFDGGTFQLRDRGSDRPRCEIANTGLGDAILFAIDPRIEHHVTPVSGSTPKTAFAGWFNTEPSFLSLLRSDGTQGDQRIDPGSTK